MSGFLAYSYSACLSEKEGVKIDQQVKKNRKEFVRGFKKGIKTSILSYSIYTLVSATPAYANDSCPDPAPVKTDPAKTGPVPTGPINNRPGFKPLSDRTKGTFAGGVCLAALQSGDFYLGVACAFLVVIAGIVVNRPDVNKPNIHNQ